MIGRFTYAIELVAMDVDKDFEELSLILAHNHEIIYIHSNIFMVRSTIRQPHISVTLALNKSYIAQRIRRTFVIEQT